MADTKTNEAKISIKVIVDKVKKRVVYAVADHTFVDILFSFITLPLGTIARILDKLDDKKFAALGSLNNLYQSLKDFPECYFSTEECKSLLLNPKSLSYDHCKNLKLKIDDTAPVCYNGCSNRRCVYVYRDWLSCPSDGCNGSTCSSSIVAGNSDEATCGVFVSDTATFIITDDLCVEPYTSASSIRLLIDFGVTNLDHLEERNIDLYSHMVLQLLKMSLVGLIGFVYGSWVRTLSGQRRNGMG